MNSRTRVLLVEHLDATGAAPADARARALALRKAGCTVEVVLLDGRADDDLLYRSADRRTGPGTEALVPNANGLRALAARVRDSGAPLVLWAGAAPGGGTAAAALAGIPGARWWPSGHAPAGTAAGPLRALPGFGPPCGASAVEAPRSSRQRLSLWDGPFVLVPAPLSEATARETFDGFAAAAAGRDEVDLVVLDHPRRRLESLARAAGMDVRTHFVGPAPREAEVAWLVTAAAVLVPGDAPVSGGLLLRALSAGTAPVPVGAAAGPIADWLGTTGCLWARPRDAEGIAGALGRALDREDGPRQAGEHAREAAQAWRPAALAARIEASLGASSRSAEAA